MIREITTHKVNGCNDEITVESTDAPGSGGAHHRYRIDGPSRRVAGVGTIPNFRCDVRFQNGPIKEAGINGVTNEALLAIVADRLGCFQSGPFACDENQEALGFVKAAMAVLKSRTEKRLARGVEGTHQK